jgi:hypothetical protein
MYYTPKKNKMAYLSNKAIVRVEITMYDVHGMEIGHARCNILGKVDSLFPGQSFIQVMNEVLQGATRNKFCDQMQLLVFIKDTNETQDIVVVQAA